MRRTALQASWNASALNTAWASGIGWLLLYEYPPYSSCAPVLVFVTHAFSNSRHHTRFYSKPSVNLVGGADTFYHGDALPPSPCVFMHTEHKYS